MRKTALHPSVTLFVIEGADNLGSSKDLETSNLMEGVTDRGDLLLG
jgi:hypothetical protein